VKDMQEKAREFNPRPLLIALAAILAAASIWAATALAADGSSSSGQPAANNGPIAVDVQQGNGDAAAPGNCPNHSNGSGGSSGGSPDSSGTSSSDF
jgi:hypothetical protein